MRGKSDEATYLKPGLLLVSGAGRLTLDDRSNHSKPRRRLRFWPEARPPNEAAADGAGREGRTEDESERVREREAE